MSRRSAARPADRDMDRNLKLHFRDELKSARLAVLADSEAFPEILYAIERTGAALINRTATLGQYRGALVRLASTTISSQRTQGERSVDKLFGLVMDGRNEALHLGVYARNLADHAVELALLLEEALANRSDIIGDYMVRHPIVAELWQPLKVVRHQMLSKSFSCLPVKQDGKWWLISDFAIARALCDAGDKTERDRRLMSSIQQAIDTLGLTLDAPQVVVESESVATTLSNQTTPAPILVKNGTGDLIGIVTPFDLL